MSKDYYCFEDEKGDTGFLAGVVDVLSDNLSMILDYGYALEADIFHVKDNDISLLNDVIRHRLYYYDICYNLYVPSEKIDALNFQLKRIDADANQILSRTISSYSSHKEISKSVDEFFRSLNWYLQKPVCIYTPTHLPDKNLNVLGQMYLSMAWEYFFIAYQEYLVLFIFGTVE